MISDENQYFYLGKLVSDGQIPYRDFFFAHPPLQIYIFAWFFRLVANPFFLVKSISIFATIISAFLIYKILKDKYSFSVSFISTALFLFTANVIYTSSVNLGINLTAMFVLLGYYYLEKDTFIATGIFFGLSLLTGLYAAVIIIPITAFNYKKIWKIINGMMFTFLPMNILMFIFARYDFINQVYLYHFLKPTVISNKLYFFSKLFKLDTLLILVFIAFIMIMIAKKRLEFDMLICIISSYLLFVILIGNPIVYYMILVYPFVVLLIGKYFNIVFESSSMVISLVVSCLLIILLFGQSIDYPGKLEQHNNLYNFDKLDEMVAFFDGKEGRLLGDYTITPLISLYSGNEMIITKEIDTYPLAIKTIGVQNMVRSIKSESPDYIIIHKMSSTINPIWKISDIYSFLVDNCAFDSRPLAEWNDYSNGYEIYGCSYS